MLPAARHDFGQNEAMRCTGQRSVLHQPSQRTAFVASPFCCAHSFRYAKTIHPARCIRPFTFERPRSRLPQSRKRLKGGKATASPTSQKPIGLECPQTLGNGGRSIILFPRASTPEAQAACIVPCRKPQGCSGQNDWPRGAFFACFRFTIAHFRQLGEKSRVRGV